MPAGPGHDVVITGFGFSGLTTLGQLVRAAPAPLRIAVVGDDLSGHGLAYGTCDPSHLLNVPARDMGAWDDHEGSFADWLAASDEEADAFVSRQTYADYIDTIRERTLARAEAAGFAVTRIEGSARGATRGDDGWTVETTEDGIRARHCVVTTGNELRSLFGDFEHARLFLGPWRLPAAGAEDWSEPVAIIGSGLTAMDAVLSLRRRGFAGQLLALSRRGLLPETFDVGAPAYEPDPRRVAAISTPAELLAILDDARGEGHDLSEVIQGLRPHIQAVWQRFSPAQQAEAGERLPARWSVARHRMAPAVADVIHEELEAGSLTITATEAIEPIGAPGGLALDVTPRDGGREQIEVAAIVDCTGPELDWSRSRRSLLRGLVDDGHVERHPTGLGVVAEHQRIGPDLYAAGSMLTGQLFESVAVPELREQAAAIAAHILG